MTTNASTRARFYALASTVTDWRRRREEIAVALDHSAIDQEQATTALFDLVDDMLAEMAMEMP